MEWRPIDTAPMDSKPVLLYGWPWLFANRGYYYDGKWGVTPDGPHFIVQPTHWMPLPEVPKMDDESSYTEDQWIGSLGSNFKDRFAGHFVDRQTGIHYYLGTGMHGEIQEVLAWVIDRPYLKNQPKLCRFLLT